MFLHKKGIEQTKNMHIFLPVTLNLHNGLGLKSFTSSGHRKSLYKVGTSNVSQLKKDIDRTKLCSFPSSDLELTKWPWVKVMRHNHIISNLLCEVRISKLQISLHKKDLDWHDFRDWRSDRQMDKIIPVYPPPPPKKNFDCLG